MELIAGQNGFGLSWIVSQLNSFFLESKIFNHFKIDIKISVKNYKFLGEEKRSFLIRYVSTKEFLR